MDSVACIIVNYNDWKRTISLVNQIIDYHAIAHVIVVDNCSSDDSRNRLENYKHGKYVLIKSGKNGGYGYGNNLGIKRAEEYGDEYILIANPDVYFSENCLCHMMDTATRIDHCAAIGAKETVIGTYAWRYTSGLQDVLSTSLFFNKALKKRYYPQSYFRGKEWVPVDVIPGCFVLMKTDVFVDVGMYDEDFFLYEEEKVVYKKLSDSGYVSAIDLGTSFEHRHIDGKLSVKKCLARKKNLIDSKVLFIKKYRKFNLFQQILSRLFFALCYCEMALYATIKTAR